MSDGSFRGGNLRFFTRKRPISAFSEGGSLALPSREGYKGASALKAWNFKGFFQNFSPEPRLTDLVDPNLPSGAPGAPQNPGDTPVVAIEDEMRRSYLEYAMSVIVSRAIPDVRDGLKPVHRRILHSMNESGFDHAKPYRKSARVVGDVMGKYHPHGDAAIYDALVRMAQDFSMSLPLLDGQGNFGSMDGDPAAAQRYTEVRMARVAEALLADIDKNTVDFQPNYDNQDREPSVLPARFPNLLVNGANGIAVGMATNIPPHNLGEVIDATLHLIANPEAAVADLMEHIPAPDFPTGGVILGRAGARAAYHRGRGSIILRAKTRFEEIRKDRMAIILDEIPYQVNKATLIEKIADLAREKKVEGVASVQDESDRRGVRVVIELKRDATPEITLNQLFKFTAMQTSFPANMLALSGGRPEVLDLKGFLGAFLAFREEAVARRTAYDLSKARERAHLLCGLAVAVENVDRVVALIRAAPDPAAAREALMAPDWPAQEIAEYIRLVDDPSHKINADGTYRLSEIQARAILDLRLQRLTAMGREEVGAELKELAAKIVDWLDILRSRPRILAIISEELTAVKSAFAGPRRTEILEESEEFEDEDLIVPEDMAVTITASGYVKRTPIEEFRSQKRGGKGLAGMSMKDEDAVSQLFVANTHTAVLFFSTLGTAYKLKVWRLPQGGRATRGKAFVNLLPLEQGETIAAVMPIDAPEEDWDKLNIVFATSDGDVRRNQLSDFSKVMSNGKRAMVLPEGVRLVGASLCDENDSILLSAAGGRATRFAVEDLRVFQSRSSTGVRGIRLVEGDEVVSMTVLRHVAASTAEISAYLKRKRQESMAEEDAVEALEAEEEENGAEEEAALSDERYAEMSEAEETVLTVTSEGFGRRTSAYYYPIKGRGAQGVKAFSFTGRRGGQQVVAALRVEAGDQLMLATDGGQAIRSFADQISLQSRSGSGVTLFRVGEGERVVSVARLAAEEEEGEG